MKKYIIVFTLILFAIIFLFQIKITKNQKPQLKQTSSTQVELGKEIKQENYLPQIQNTNIAQLQPSSYIPSTTCNKTFEDILLEYGKEWGPIKNKKLTFTTEETNNIINLINNYTTCLAIAQKDISICNLLSFTKDQCINAFYNYSFTEFLFGANKNEQDCKNYIDYLKRNPKNDDMKLTSLNISSDRLCSEIKKDIRGICDRLFTEKSQLEKCYNVFPKNILERCPRPDNPEICVRGYENAKKTGDLDCDILDDNKKELCYIAKKGKEMCNPQLQQLTSTYCLYQENIKKKLAEFEEKKKIEEQKIEAEKEKLRKAKEEEERKKLEGEIIKKAKQAAEEAKKFKGRKNEEE